jgi:hypothetical protein
MAKETSFSSIPTRPNSRTRPYLDLFAVSFLLLFFELACIRWFGGTVVFLTFFTNIVLLATFLGMSVGCLASSSQRDWNAAVIPLLLWASVLAVGVLWSYEHFGRIMVDVGGQGSPQQVYFGTEYRARDISTFVIPIELLASIFFVLIALVFVGVGQVMGRAFNEAPDRLMAYVCNIAGSLAGIVAFAVASFWQTTPLTWFAVVGLIWIYFLRRRTALQIVGLLATVVLIGSSAAGETLMWSPYYKIHYVPETRQIQTNNIGHQQMQPLEQQGSGYRLPHLLNRHVGGGPFQNVLIIGAGSGNDVAAALAAGAKHVDAVEIDPAIYGIGRREHPNHPYQDPRVTVHIDDGRSFLRKTNQQYDLIVYALVDSLVLHSGYSSLRLESFLFTQEAFDDIAKRLTPNGTLAVYNFFRQGWIVGRVARMAEQSLGSPPLIISLPYRDRIRSDDALGDRVTFVLASHPSGLANLRAQFRNQSFWVSRNPALVDTANGFGPQPPGLPGATDADWNRIAPALLETPDVTRVPTDDWPFLYLREASVPALNVRSVVLLGALSVLILALVSPVRRVGPNWQMFFLGAGFMLLETKGVVHMALLFGSTWFVNSVVFAAILTMILASNLFVALARPASLKPYYVLLAVALLVNILVPMRWFLALPGLEKVVASCIVTFVPIFFAGIVFGTLFRDSRQPDIDFGSNIAGAMLGGLTETLSLIVGFNYLVAIALIFYALSAVLKRSTVIPVAGV